MTLQFGAATENIAAADPQDFTHDGGTAPKAVVVCIAHGTVSTDIVVGVTYGGIALTRIRTNVDSAGEPGRAYVYFLGAGIPTSSQTVSVDRNQATTSVFAVCVTLLGSGDTESVANDGLTDDQTNPKIALTTGQRIFMAIGVIYSGRPNTTDLTDDAGQTRVHGHDFGAFVAVCSRSTNPDHIDNQVETGRLFGYIAASDDVAFSGCAISEIRRVKMEPHGGTRRLW